MPFLPEQTRLPGKQTQQHHNALLCICQHRRGQQPSRCELSLAAMLQWSFLFLCTAKAGRDMRMGSPAGSLYPASLFFFFGLTFGTRRLTAQKSQILQLPWHRLTNNPSPGACCFYTTEKSMQDQTPTAPKRKQSKPKKHLLTSGTSAVWLYITSKKKQSSPFTPNSHSSSHSCNQRRKNKIWT